MSLSKRLGRLALPKPAVTSTAVRDPLCSEEFREELVSWFSPEQQRPLLDPSSYQVWAAGRRAAKTTIATARWLLARCAAGEESVYVAPTKQKAWSILSPKATELCRHFPPLRDLLVEDKAKQTLVYTPTGARLTCFGLSSERDAELLRGTRAPFAVLDELGALHAERLQLALEALTPAMADFSGQPGSALILAGTASRAYGGFVHSLFEDCPATAHWNEGRKQPSRHKWTLQSNPRFASTWQTVFEEECARRGITQADPWFRREYLAEFVLNAAAGAFPGTASLEASSAPPAGSVMVYGLSVSLLAKSAVAAVARHADGSLTVVFARYLPAGQSLLGFARELRALMSQHGPGLVWTNYDGKAVAKGLERTAGLGAAVADTRPGPDLVTRMLQTDALASQGLLRFGPGASLALSEMQAAVYDDAETGFHTESSGRGGIQSRCTMTPRLDSTPARTLGVLKRSYVP